MRSLPQVTIRPLDVSMSMWLMLCFPSWNVASGVRLRQSTKSRGGTKQVNVQPFLKTPKPSGRSLLTLPL